MNSLEGWEKLMKKITAILLAAGLFVGMCPSQMNQAAAARAAEEIQFHEEAETREVQWEDKASSSGEKKAAGVGNETNGQDKGLYFKLSKEQWDGEEDGLFPGDMSGVSYEYENVTDTPYTLQVSSSNTNVIKITSENPIVIAERTEGMDSISFKAVNPGVSEIIVKAGVNIYKTKVHVLPPLVEMKGIKQAGYKSVQLKWNKIAGCSGYLIERASVGKSNYKTVKSVYGGENASATVDAEWNKPYSYRVVGFIKDGERIIRGRAEVESEYNFTVRKIGAEITSIKKSGSRSLLIRWKPMKGAVGYKLYRCAYENGAYKCVSKISGGSKSSYKQKVNKGVTYFYKLVTVYPEGESEFSRSVSQFIPKSGKAKAVEQNNVSGNAGFGGQYGGNWAHSDDTYYYQANGKLHVVCVQRDASLKIYTLDSALKVKSTKTVNIGYDRWGGFYHGPDGNFYVAVGYANHQESKTKTVIKVIKYNSRWKKGKTASIKGGASNSFVGIYEPFDAGNCRMEMQGSMLYLVTSRTMFQGSDGLRHQSNISFKIDTKKMKVKQANDSYVSHSFNQFVKFKDGSLYVLDHGDAYPRSLVLTMVDRYGTEDSDRSRKGVFSFQGETGNNYTGCKLGGMEIGEKNVLACGISVPHKYKVKGVSGSDSSLKKNVYLTVTNRKTGKTKVKWLTQYNPKTSSVTVGEARMVKLSDTRFAVMYSVTQGNAKKLQYVVVSDTGKKICAKTYTDLSFSASSQPILNKGKIVWMETSYNADFSGTRTRLFSIPAIY